MFKFAVLGKEKWKRNVKRKIKCSNSPCLGEAREMSLLLPTSIPHSFNIWHNSLFLLSHGSWRKQNPIVLFIVWKYFYKVCFVFKCMFTYLWYPLSPWRLWKKIPQLPNNILLYLKINILCSFNIVYDF